MQDCFRQYPDIYGAELAEEEEALQEGQPQPSAEYEKVQEKVPAVSNATSSVDASPETSTLPVSKAADGEAPAQGTDVTKTDSEVDEVPKHEEKHGKD